MALYKQTLDAYKLAKLPRPHSTAPVTMVYEIAAPERRASESKGRGTSSQV